MKEHAYYCYEREYPFYIRIAEKGKSVRLPLECYGDFDLRGNIMLSWNEFHQRLLAGKLDRPVTLWDEVQ